MQLVGPFFVCFSDGFFFAVFAFRQVQACPAGAVADGSGFEVFPGPDAPPFYVKPHDCWPEYYTATIGKGERTARRIPLWDETRAAP